MYRTAKRCIQNCWNSKQEGNCRRKVAVVNFIHQMAAAMMLKQQDLGEDNVNSAFHPSGVGKWVPASAGKAKAGMVRSISGCTRGVQVKLWNPLRTRAIPELLWGVFTTRRYTNLTLPYLTLQEMRLSELLCAVSCTAAMYCYNHIHTSTWKPVSPSFSTA